MICILLSGFSPSHPASLCTRPAWDILIVRLGRAGAVWRVESWESVQCNDESTLCTSPGPSDQISMEFSIVIIRQLGGREGGRDILKLNINLLAPSRLRVVFLWKFKMMKELTRPCQSCPNQLVIGRTEWSLLPGSRVYTTSPYIFHICRKTFFL